MKPNTIRAALAAVAATTATLTSYAETHTLQPYAYVQSYGCNRVDTGYRANKDSRFVADCSFESIKKSWIYGCGSGQIHGFYLNGNTPTRIAWTTNGEHWRRVWNPGEDKDGYIKPVVGRRLVSVVNSTDGTATMTYYENRTEHTSTIPGTLTTTPATANTVLFAYTVSNTEFVDCKLYSFEADDDCTSGVPAVFLAPTVDAEGNAGFTNIVDGTFHGEANTGAATALSFSGGIGNASDYKYENATFYAKCYAYSADTGRGSVKFGTDAASGTASAWVARGGSVTLTAVPAEGWVFIGWTGDTWAISTGSASDAVVSVSNERAVQLLATFARPAKPVSAYAQSGTSALLAHLDAIENVGAGMHQNAAPTWTDLTGNLTLTKTGAAGFIADAWKANGSTYFQTSSTAAKDALAAKAFTLELVISHPDNQVKDSYEYWTYFGKDGSHRQLVVDLRQKNSSNPLVQGVQYRESGWNSRSQFATSTITKWNKRQYIAVVCDSTGATTYCNGTNQIHKTMGGSVNPDQEAIYIGASFNGDAYLYNGSEICAVRMTSRALNADELMQNWYIDTQRFNMTTVPAGYRFTDGVLEVRVTKGVSGYEFSTDGGTTWSAGEAWMPINASATLSARYAADHSASVPFIGVPAGATVSGNDMTLTPTRPYDISAGFPTLDATGSTTWGDAAWTLGEARCDAPTSGAAVINVSGDTSLTLDEDVALDGLTLNGSGLLTIFTGSHTFTVAATDRASAARYIVCDGTDANTAVWTGGASGDFSTASNWRNSTIPQDGWRVILANATAASLTNNIADFSPSNIEFAAGSAQITVSGNAITNLVTVKNYAEAHHVFSNAVFFADGQVADILGASSSANFIKYLGGMTMYMPPKDPAAGDSRAEATGIWLAGDVTITADIPDWTPGTSIGFLCLTTCGTLTIPHSVVVSGVPNFLVGQNTTLHIMGDMTLNCSSGTGYFSNYIAGMMIIDGWAKKTGTAQCRFSEQKGGTGWIKAYGIDANNRVVLNGGDSSGSAGRWELGAGGVKAGTQIYVQDQKVAYINASADFTIAGDLRLAAGSANNHPKLYLGPQGHTITLAHSHYEGNTKNSSLIVQGSGTVLIESNLTPATEFQCNGTTTVAVKPGVSMGSGSVSVASGATFKVSESGTLDRAGNMTIADGATLAFNFTDKATAPTLALASGKTATISGAVNVKISATDDLRPKDGTYALTSGFDFTGKTVNVVDQPDWVKSVSVDESGNLVLTTRTGSMVIVW